MQRAEQNYSSGMTSDSPRTSPLPHSFEENSHKVYKNPINRIKNINTVMKYDKSHLPSTKFVHNTELNIFPS